MCCCGWERGVALGYSVLLWLGEGYSSGRQCVAMTDRGSSGQQCDITRDRGSSGHQFSIMGERGSSEQQCSVAGERGCCGQQRSMTGERGCSEQQCSVVGERGCCGQQCSVTGEMCTSEQQFSFRTGVTFAFDCMAYTIKYPALWTTVPCDGGWDIRQFTFPQQYNICRNSCARKFLPSDGSCEL